MTAHLFSPLVVGPLHAPGRVVMAPMETGLHPGGVMDQRYIDFLSARADADIAWVTTGGVAVRGDGLSTRDQLRLDDDRQLDGFRHLAAAVHDRGGRLVIQLTHAGRQTLASLLGQDPVAPSPIPCPMMKQRPRALEIEELPGLVTAFADAARRAAAAGADGVELHMGHGYLLNQFLSPATNQRDDEYGGSTTDRCRLPVQVLRAVCRAVGPDCLVSVRFSADERMAGGIDIEEAVRIAWHLEKGGAHVLHISACTYASMMWNIPVYLLEDAPFRPLAARVRRAVEIPVIAVGRLHEPALMEETLASGDADLIAVGRPFIADADFGRKLREGDSPRPCIRCNRCIHSISYGPLACTVNPDVGHEGAIPPDAPPQRLLVVGGGPAGMTAATRAALAGHAVRLLERGSALGGQLNAAAVGPHKQRIAELSRQLQAELRASGAEILLDTAIDRQAMVAFDPDVVFDATGSQPPPLQMEGAAFPVTGLDDALLAPSPAGTLVIVGGGPGGIEAAHTLAATGLAVVLLEKRPRIGVGMVPHARFHLERLLTEHGVRVITRARTMEADADKLRVIQRRGEETITDVAQLIVATGRESKGIDPAIYSGFKARIVPVGDAVKPGSIQEALSTARRAVDEEIHARRS